MSLGVLRLLAATLMLVPSLVAALVGPAAASSSADRPAAEAGASTTTAAERSPTTATTSTTPHRTAYAGAWHSYDDRASPSRERVRVSAGVLATKAGGRLPSLPSQLAGGPKNVHVYRGIDENGDVVYSGITNDLKRRAAQHGDRFSALDPVTTTGAVTRGEARAIEQALILRSRGQNQINAISPRHPYYDDAVEYGRAWLREAGQ